MSGWELARVAPRTNTDTPEQRFTRRGVLATSLQLAGAGALALVVSGGAAHRDVVFAQETATPPAGEVTGEADAGIQVGTTEDAAATDAQTDVEALPPADDAAVGDEATREERRAAREGEEGAVGAGDVSTVPATGVGSAIGSPLGAAGAIGLAAASAAAAIVMRRDAARAEAGIE